MRVNFYPLKSILNYIQYLCCVSVQVDADDVLTKETDPSSVNAKRKCEQAISPNIKSLVSQKSYY